MVFIFTQHHGLSRIVIRSDPESSDHTVEECLVIIEVFLLRVIRIIRHAERRVQEIDIHI